MSNLEQLAEQLREQGDWHAAGMLTCLDAARKEGPEIEGELMAHIAKFAVEAVWRLLVHGGRNTEGSAERRS